MGTETGAGMREEWQPGVGLSSFTGTGTTTFSSWVRILISVNTEKQTDSVLGPVRVGFQFLVFPQKIFLK